jgi:hypothetical protein
VPAQVRSAHGAAVEAALAYLEREAGFGRRRVDGDVRSVRAGGFVAAAFQHRTSRAGDPLLHTHALVANLLCAEDGRWGAIDGRLLYAHAKAAGALYQAELRTQLTRRLGVAWTPVHYGLADVEGIPATALRAFSRRRQEIAAHMAARGETSAKAAQVATLQTRKAKDYGVHAEGLLPEWRRRAASLGFGPEALAATLGRVAAPGLDEEDVVWAVDSLLGTRGLTAHASSFTRRDVVVALGDWLSPATAAADVELVAERLLADPDVVAVGGTNTAARVHTRAGLGGDHTQLLPEPDERRFTTRDLLAIEQHLVEGALARRACGAGRATTAAIETALAARPSLSAEQVAMCRRVLSSGDGVEVVRGHAGTGKTHGLDGCRVAWESSGLRVLGCALSARAAAELQAGAGITSSTVHRLLFELGDRDAAQRYHEVEEQLAWRQREASLRLDARTVLVVDEASMVGTRMLAKLLESVRRAHAKAVLVGDDAQLPEIDAGGAFRGLAARLGAAELTDNRRQHAQWERQALRLLREGHADDALSAYAAHGRVVTGASAEAVRSRMVADWWAAQRVERADVVMVACRRADVRDLNERARALRVAAGEVSGAELVLPGGAVAVGDRVMTRRNDRRLGVRNGSRGTVNSVDPNDGSVDVALDGGQQRHTTVRLPRDYLEAGHLTHAYALTAHTAQGMTAERALILGDDSVYREWGYVALTRGREENRLYVVAGERATQVREALHGRAALAQPLVRELINSLKRSRAQRLALDEGTPSIEVSAAERQRLRSLSDADLVEELRCARGRVPASPRPPDISDIALTRAEQEAAQARTHLEEGQARVEALRARLDGEGQLARWLHRQQRDRNEQALSHEEDRLPKFEEQCRTADAQVTALRAQHQERTRWDAEYTRLRSEDHARGQAIHAELRRREREHVRAMAVRLARLEAAPPPYLLAALGERPDGAAEQRSWRQAALELEEHRDAYRVADPNRPLGDTLLTSAGCALLRRLEGARTPDTEGAAPPVARRELDSVLAEIRRHDAKRERGSVLQRERARREQEHGLHHPRHHAAHRRTSGRGPSLTA